MCPEDFREWLDQLSLLSGSGYDLERIGLLEDGSSVDPYNLIDEGSALWAASIKALPAHALCTRLVCDPTVRSWVADIHSVGQKFRAARAEELANGAPRGTGRDLIGGLLLRASESGKAGAMMLACGFGASLDSLPEPEPHRRAPKDGLSHDLRRGLILAADRTVRRLTSYPQGIALGDNPEADRRAEQRLIHAAARQIGSKWTLSGIYNERELAQRQVKLRSRH